MGKIIRNGIEYGGTYDSAISVNYDNSVSGLNARTVQEGIDELNESLNREYQLLGTRTQINSILFDIPQNCKNLILYTSSTGDNLMSVFVPLILLINSGKEFSVFVDGGHSARASIAYTDGKINFK